MDSTFQVYMDDSLVAGGSYYIKDSSLHVKEGLIGMEAKWITYTIGHLDENRLEISLWVEEYDMQFLFQMSRIE